MSNPTTPESAAAPSFPAQTGSDLLIFQERELRAAYEYAMRGGQALHLMGGRYAYLRKDTPGCFKGRKTIAHLFDQDKARLIKTAKRFGVRVIRVEHEGTKRQHIDLCGKPLARAEDLARQQEWERDHGFALDGQNNGHEPRP